MEPISLTIFAIVVTSYFSSLLTGVLRAKRTTASRTEKAGQRVARQGQMAEQLKAKLPLLERKMGAMVTATLQVYERLDEVTAQLRKRIEILIICYGVASIILKSSFNINGILTVVLYFIVVMVLFTITLSVINPVVDVVRKIEREQYQLRHEVGNLRAEINNIREGVFSNEIQSELNQRMEFLLSLSRVMLDELSDYRSQLMNYLFQGLAFATIFGVDFLFWESKK